MWEAHSCPNSGPRLSVSSLSNITAQYMALPSLAAMATATAKASAKASASARHGGNDTGGEGSKDWVAPWQWPPPSKPLPRVDPLHTHTSHTTHHTTHTHHTPHTTHHTHHTPHTTHTTHHTSHITHTTQTTHHTPHTTNNTAPTSRAPLHLAIARCRRGACRLSAGRTPPLCEPGSLPCGAVGVLARRNHTYTSTNM
jgi:hypothetical protein